MYSNCWNFTAWDASIRCKSTFWTILKSEIPLSSCSKKLKKYRKNRKTRFFVCVFLVKYEWKWKFQNWNFVFSRVENAVVKCKCVCINSRQTFHRLPWASKEEFSGLPNVKKSLLKRLVFQCPPSGFPI